MIWSNNIQTFTRHPGAWFILGLILCAIFAPLLVLDSSEMANDMDLQRAMLAPGSSSEMGTHWFGTDKFGRDHFSRIILGSRISLTVGLIAVSISLVIGIPIGAAAGYFGGRVDQFLSWLMSVLWSIPTLLLVIALTFVLGKGLTQVFIAVGLTMWVEVARVVRGQFLAEKQKEYVEAAKFASALLIESGLSFLGIGAQPPMPSWGSMIRDYYPYLMTGKAYLSLIPGALIAASVLSLNSLSAALSKDQ
jgi:peptide/nickel transport system permease protein